MHQNCKNFGFDGESFKKVKFINSANIKVARCHVLKKEYEKGSRFCMRLNMIYVLEY